MHATDCRLKVWLQHVNTLNVNVLVHELTKRVYSGGQLRYHHFEQSPCVITSQSQVVCGRVWR